MNRQEIENWLKENIGDNFEIINNPTEREKDVDYHYIPQTEDEFHSIIKNAPDDFLEGLGFWKFGNINSIINNNKTKPISNVIRLPILNSPGEYYETDLGRKNNPTEELEVNENLFLFPGEWYNIIPNGFIVTGLNAEKYPFEKGISDDDTRYGCLPYGITKLIY